MKKGSCGMAFGLHSGWAAGGSTGSGPCGGMEETVSVHAKLAAELGKAVGSGEPSFGFGKICTGETLVRQRFGSHCSGCSCKSNSFTGDLRLQATMGLGSLWA